MVYPEMYQVTEKRAFKQRFKRELIIQMYKKHYNRIFIVN